MDAPVKRLTVLLVLVVACSGTPKVTEDRESKCADAPGLAWQYDHTEYWTTTEAVYGVKTSINSKGELVTSYGITGYETVEHSRDVYDCWPRR